MANQIKGLNPQVTEYLHGIHHPMIKEIGLLRTLILESSNDLSENIKWNGPNYYVAGGDRITMRIHPPKQLQIIFHRGAKVQEQPKDKLIEDRSSILQWKANDRAVASFKSMEEIRSAEKDLKTLIVQWLAATR